MDKTIDLGFLELIGFGALTMMTSYLFNDWGIPLGTFIVFVVFGVIKSIKDDRKDKREKAQDKRNEEKHQLEMKILRKKLRGDFDSSEDTN